MGRLYTAMKSNPDLRKELNGGNSHLYNAMAKYGVNTFRIEVLEEISDELLNDTEAKYIAQYKCVENGYNIREGGNRTEHSVETCDLISKNTKEAFNDINIVKKMRKYNEKLDDLPPKCTYGKSNGRDCYRIRRHATIKDKCFYVKSYNSEEECKSALIDYIKSYDPKIN